MTETTETSRLKMPLRRYHRALFVTALLASIPALLVLFVWIFNRVFLLEGYAFCLLWLILWWGQVVSLKRGSRSGFLLSFSIAVVMWTGLFFQTVRRILFMVEHGGMERSDGYGSPLAFLLGFVTEQLLFLPLTVVVIFGIQAGRHLRQVSQADPER